MGAASDTDAESGAHDMEGQADRRALYTGQKKTSITRWAMALYARTASIKRSTTKITLTKCTRERKKEKNVCARLDMAMYFQFKNIDKNRIDPSKLLAPHRFGKPAERIGKY